MEGTGGYARPGLIILGGLEDEGYSEHREGWFRYVSHEAAHLWWTGAPVDSWEDWLNESFAEYVALLAIREVFGEQSYQRRLDEKRDRSEGVPEIWGLKRNGSTEEENREIEIVLYSKGPVLLGELSDKITDSRFIGLCREMVSQEATSTQQFLDLLRNRESSEVSDWFEKMLRAQ